ncbi:hypothetical protein OSTOST_06081 [Ostertagia ostertagi]
MLHFQAMIDYTIFECEIEPTCEKDPSRIPSKRDDDALQITCPLARDRRLQTLRKHLEQVYEADRALLRKMSHCTAYTQMTEIVAGLKVVRLLEKAVQRRIFNHLKESSRLKSATQNSR